ncbi:MAG: non-homologous end-joining DNA ligase, partial [Candidatus Limnocylindria bacterium]
MPLEEYRRKRDFGATPEPAPGELVERSGRFTIQRHRATALHYDVRLEIGGVLVSWAVPKGPSLDPSSRRLAMRTEDHPIEYFDFEGAIPDRQYGAGDVIVWDWGTYEPEAETPDPESALRAGEIKFEMHGQKVRGRFTIVRTDGRGDGDERERWLLIHKRDGSAVEGWDAEDHPASVKTGRTNDEVRDGVKERFSAVPPEPVAPIDLAAARPERMPAFIAPMRATLADAAFDSPDWLFEIKWDGYRVEAVIRGESTRLWTRNQQDAARYFPDLAGPATWLDASEAIVDGEVVALDPEGRPSFSLLQDRTGIRTGRKPGSARPGPPAPVVYQAFDLLHLDGQSLLAVPLVERKRLLRSRLRPHLMVRYASHVEGEGRAFIEAARAQELEGIVAKLRSSPYEPGRRAKTWLKVKLRAEQEVVVVGWLPGQGSHRDLGSLIVAVRSGDGWAHAGQVGSGIGARTRRELRETLDSLERPASVLDPVPRLKGAHWVEPMLVIRVEFADWTADGLLRQAAFKGLEVGKTPSSVRRERSVRVATAVAEPTTKAHREPMQAPNQADAALDAIEGEGMWEVAGRELRVTNLDKPLFPGRSGGGPITKRDLLRYHLAIGPTLVPYLADRGLTV